MKVQRKSGHDGGIRGLAFGATMAALLLASVALTMAAGSTKNLILPPRPAAANGSRVVLSASVALDGKGGIIRDTNIVIENGKIIGLEKTAAGTVIDLRGLTVLPGWIDTHTHPTYHFGPNGRAADRDERPSQAAFAAASNAYATLLAGFTTIQSIGAAADKDLRDAIDRGDLPGSRLLTSLEALNERSGTPDEIRKLIRQRKEEGADLIKLFASKSIREGGAKTMTDEQLGAACGEAKSIGLRVLVHAHSADSVRAATLAGCTQIEHGIFATSAEMKLMAEHGTYFDPQLGLVFQNYLDNKSKYLGIGNFSEDAFEAMAKAMPLAAQMFQKAIATPGLKIVYGTDAVAGAHGHNAEEFLYRVRNGKHTPMQAMVSANSLAAESLGLEKKIGTIAPGMEADIIALDGNPLEDITAVQRVVFVMKGGRIYKNSVARPAQK